MKLLIGSRIRVDGWSSLDIVPGPGVDFVADCRDLSQFADDSVEALYASHVLEHVPYGDPLVNTLRGWHRVLVPGGQLLVAVPDFELLCRMFLSDVTGQQDKYKIMRCIFGGQMDPHDFHYVGITWPFLAGFLDHAGFKDARRVDDLGVLDDQSRQQLGGLRISLNVIAQK